MEAVARFAAAVLAQVRSRKLVPLETLRSERFARNADIRRSNKTLELVARERDTWAQRSWDGVTRIGELRARLQDQSEELRDAERTRNEAAEAIRHLTDAAELARLKERDKQQSKALHDAQETLRRTLCALVGVTSIERVPVREVLVLHTSDGEAGIDVAKALRDEFNVPVVILEGEDDLTGLDEDMMRERGWLKVASLEGQVRDDLRAAIGSYFAEGATPEGLITLRLDELDAHWPGIDQSTDPEANAEGSET